MRRDRAETVDDDGDVPSVNQPAGSESPHPHANAEAAWARGLRGLFHALDPTENEDTHEDLIGNALMGR